MEELNYYSIAIIILICLSIAFKQNKAIKFCLLLGVGMFVYLHHIGVDTKYFSENIFNLTIHEAKMFSFFGVFLVSLYTFSSYKNKLILWIGIALIGFDAANGMLFVMPWFVYLASAFFGLIVARISDYFQKNRSFYSSLDKVLSSPFWIPYSILKAIFSVLMYPYRRFKEKKAHKIALQRENEKLQIKKEKIRLEHQLEEQKFRNDMELANTINSKDDEYFNS